MIFLIKQRELVLKCGTLLQSYRYLYVFYIIVDMVILYFFIVETFKESAAWERHHECSVI